MNKTNRILAVVCFFISIILFILTPSQVSTVSSTTTTLGADFFPTLVAALLMIAAIGLFVQTHFAIKGGYETEQAPEMDWRKEKRVAVVFAMVLVYMYLMRTAGFILSSVAIGAVLLWFLGGAKWWHYLTYLASVILIFFVFTDCLYVWLPTLGVWIF